MVNTPLCSALWDEIHALEQRFREQLTTESLKDKLDNAAETVSEKLSDAAETVSEKLSEAGSTIREGLTDLSEALTGEDASRP